MNDILIKIDTKTAKAYCENNRIGVQHANLQNKLKFEMSEKITGSAWLEYEIDGNKNYAEMEETDDGYQIDIKSCLLVSNIVNVDLKITESENADGIPIFISTIVELDVDESINATEEEPEYYPDWKTVADSKIAEMNQLKEEIEAAIEETNNLDLDISKEGKIATVTLTKKDATTKFITLSDGTNLMFNWNGTRLGIKTDEDAEYTYVDLIGPQGIQGETGTTPNLTIGTVVTGNTSSATITGTPENPILNLVLEKGETGETGTTGNGISSIEKTGTQDNVDTYTIYYTNGTTSTFTVTNSTVTNQEFEELKAEHEELVNTLPRVEGTGESITLDNTAQYKMNVALSGNTSQTTYTGVQLFDKSTVVTGYINADGSISSNNAYVTTDYIPIDSTSQYSKTATNSPRIKLYDENKNLLSTSSYSDIASFGNEGTYTIPETNAKYIRFTIRVETGFSDINTVMFVKGSTLPTSYEPYVGGIPSPNPLYPQPIKKVTGNNSITVCGKNLFNINNPYSNSGASISVNNNQLTVTKTTTTSANCYTAYRIYNIINNTTYNFSYTAVADNIGAYAIRGYKKDGTYVNIKGSTQSLNVDTTITIPNDIYYLTIFFYVSIAGNAGSLNDKTIYSNIQLEHNTIKTTYEPYQGQTYPINLGSSEYCKIGDYSDKFALSTGENLFDGIIELGTINNSGKNVDNDNTIRSVNFIPVESNTQYTFNNNKNYHTYLYEYDENEKFISATIGTSETINPFTFITSATTKYIRFRTYTSSIENDLTVKVWLNKGNTAPTWEPYGIGNWYIKRNIRKVVLDGTEIWTNMGWAPPKYAFRVPISDIKQTTGGTRPPNCMSDYYKSDSYNNMQNSESKYGLANRNNQPQIVFRNDDYSTATDFKEWLTTHNTTVYYILATPIGEQITDTTLIEQLNNLYNQIKSYKGQTNITQTNDELPFNIDASALYDLNNLISRVATLETEV